MKNVKIDEQIKVLKSVKPMEPWQHWCIKYLEDLKKSRSVHNRGGNGE